MKVVMSAQREHKRPVISSPESHISAFCQYVASYPRMSRCSAPHTYVFCLLGATCAVQATKVGLLVLKK